MPVTLAGLHTTTPASAGEIALIGIFRSGAHRTYR